MSKIFLALVMVALTSCATVSKVPFEVSAPQHVIDRNYTIGQPASSYVGGSVVRVKDYWVSTASQQELVADNDFVLDMPMLVPDETFRRGERFRVEGTIEREGRTYRIAQAPRPSMNALGFLIKEDGSFDGRAVGIGGAYMGFTYTPNPSSIRLKSETSTTVLSDSGFTNYEIVYTGASSDAITMMYREFTPDNMARPAFTQNLTYARNSQYIRFRDVRIKVIEASNEQLRYIVEADGHN
ncbi:hypothetical protein [Solilutibacter oculi]|uniref:hypothetical protein n=1 Tax=Solilutibacter oculi TaxID=2698682 RepID=UPI0013A62497|nr:hypothetical protein [Lysobacter oculi]